MLLSLFLKLLVTVQSRWHWAHSPDFCGAIMYKIAHFKLSLTEISVSWFYCLILAFHRYICIGIYIGQCLPSIDSYFIIRFVYINHYLWKDYSTMCIISTCTWILTGMLLSLTQLSASVSRIQSRNIEVFVNLSFSQTTNWTKSVLLNHQHCLTLEEIGPDFMLSHAAEPVVKRFGHGSASQQLCLTCKINTSKALSIALARTA